MEIEVTKSAKQESRGFSHERFKENNNDNQALMIKLLCSHKKNKKFVAMSDLFYYKKIENMEAIYRKLSDFVFSDKRNFIFPIPTDKNISYLRTIKFVVEEFKCFRW